MRCPICHKIQGSLSDHLRQSACGQHPDAPQVQPAWAGRTHGTWTAVQNYEYDQSTRRLRHRAGKGKKLRATPR